MVSIGCLIWRRWTGSPLLPFWSIGPAGLHCCGSIPGFCFRPLFLPNDPQPWCCGNELQYCHIRRSRLCGDHLLRSPREIPVRWAGGICAEVGLNNQIQGFREGEQVSEPDHIQHLVHDRMYLFCENHDTDVWSKQQGLSMVTRRH